MATSTLGNGTLVLAGTTSGTTTVTATAVAGTTTLTLPAATDTLVGKATTDTLTNKTLTGAVMNGTLGATTPSTVAATSISASTTLGVTGVSTLTGGAVIEGLTVGKGAGAVSTNTAVGASALAANTTGANNTAIGSGALLTNITGSLNTAVGVNSLNKNTADDNTAVGVSAMNENTTGGSGVGIGREALRYNTTGSFNTAVGRSALVSNTTASNNTAVGYQAGYTNTTGGSSVYIGNLAGYTSNNNGNTFVGFAAGYYSTGTRNTFIGGGISGSSDGAGSAMTTGSKNTILGTYNGNQGGLDIRTASNHIVLSDGDGNPRGWFNDAGNFRIGNVTGGTRRMQVESASANFTIGIYNTNASPYGCYAEYSTSPNDIGSQFFQGVDSTASRFEARANGGIANYSANNVNLSDRREKTNFAPAKSYLDVICAIPVQTFNYIDQNMEDDGGLTLGVVAQDVQAVAPELVMESDWGTEENPKMRLSIYQTDLQYALMKCIQELKAEVDSLKAQINGASA